MNEKGWLSVIFAVAAVVGVIAITSHVTIDSGYVGVAKTFGSVDPVELQPGWNWKYPWTDVTEMFVESQSYEFVSIAGTPTKEGSSIVPDIAIQWQLNSTMADQIYVNAYEHNYFKHWIVNEFMSITRTEIQKHTLADIYTGNTSEISKNIKKELVNKLEYKGVIITDVNFRGVTFSDQVSSSLDSRASANIAVETAEKNKLARMIEADGIDYWNRKVGTSVTDTLNQYILNSGIANNKNAVYYMNAGQSGSGPATSVLIGGGFQGTTVSAEVNPSVKALAPTSSEPVGNSGNEESPGFEGILAVAGILAVVLVAMHRKRS